MNRITFLTTNNIKVAHAKHLFADFDVEIVQHKVLYYGRGYEEPRIHVREELLNLSALDAIERWKRNISDAEKMIYFLEDTSVKIDALSTPEKEVPGVDIKYWMRENSFKQLDAELKSLGNNRKAIVNSHVVLFLSKDLIDFYNKDYIVFSSNSKGTIVDSEFEFNTNPIFPWLDNKSFNKWFIPDGATKPISMLPIDEADQYDFRKGAFSKMMHLLHSHNKIRKKESLGREIRFSFHPNYIIVGPTCAGKTTIGRFLCENYGYYHIEASDFMSLIYHETHGHQNVLTIDDFAKALLLEKPHAVVDKILEFLDNFDYLPPIVITGFRTPLEINHFKTKFPIKNDVYFIYVEADYDVRFQRWKLRNRDNSLNDENFHRSNRLQDEIGLSLFRNEDLVIRIQNGGTIQEYFTLFTTEFKVPSTLKQSVSIGDQEISPSGLELPILYALAIDYLAGKDEFYTTTEIASKINKTFSFTEIPKHKDNVSRYFNQKFYPYYRCKVQNRKNLYKLSSTGLSYLLKLLKSNNRR